MGRAYCFVMTVVFLIASIWIGCRSDEQLETEVPSSVEQELYVTESGEIVHTPPPITPETLTESAEVIATTSGLSPPLDEAPPAPLTHPGPCLEILTTSASVAQVQYTYDTAGNLVSEAYDARADGTIDKQTHYTVDANGNRLVLEADTRLDGIIDRRVTYTYDPNGRLIQEDEDLGPYDGTGIDGVVDMRLIYTHDADGYLTMMDEDASADGTVERRFRYTYDAQGRQLTAELDSNVDGIPESRRTFRYADDGFLIAEEIDSDLDGTPEDFERWTYDSQGNKLTWEETMGSTMLRSSVYSYDCWQ